MKKLKKDKLKEIHRVGFGGSVDIDIEGKTVSKYTTRPDEAYEFNQVLFMSDEGNLVVKLEQTPQDNK